MVQCRMLDRPPVIGNSFKLVSDFSPQGDQTSAIDTLTERFQAGARHEVLLGVTGSGKTFTTPNVTARLNRPTLVLVHNKTLAAQLCHELKTFFPENAVGYFVSYYDYYQPEAYLPQTDTYIEKDTKINDAIDRMRHAATSSLFERNDVIIVASVSCIYGLGSPEAYHGMLIPLERGMRISREELLSRLVDIQYERNDVDFHRGTFRVRGDVIDVFPASAEAHSIRIELWGDQIEALSELDPLTGRVLRQVTKAPIYPGSHYVIPPDRLDRALAGIESELGERVRYFKQRNQLVEAQRIEQRTHFDLEMIREIGFCQGIENYSRHLSGRAPGEPPPTLIDYFPKDFLLIVDESHATIPQVGGMYEGDYSRKKTLVEYGFRLPSAVDNRPLKFVEFERCLNQVVYVSATPGPYELKHAHGHVVEQVIRPTGLMDPVIEVRPAKGQVDDLLGEVRAEVAQGGRVLVTTLTKRMAEDLTEYYHDLGVKVRYLHSDIKTLERAEIVRDLRRGVFDVLVGINLLREGLDLPEVSLVAILDADKEGFLRSERSLIQIAGRAARNNAGEVIMYADEATDSIKKAVAETERRIRIQEEFNREHGIIPKTIYKTKEEILRTTTFADSRTPVVKDEKMDFFERFGLEDRVLHLEKAMRKASAELDFEKAALFRDEILKLKSQLKKKKRPA